MRNIKPINENEPEPEYCCCCYYYCYILTPLYVKYGDFETNLKNIQINIDSKRKRKRKIKNNQIYVFS